MGSQRPCCPQWPATHGAGQRHADRPTRPAGRGQQAMSALTIALLLASTVLAAAQNQTTFRDASGRTTGTVTTDSNGTRTFRDGSGRTSGTATTDSNGTTTFRDASGRTTGTASRPRR